MMGAAEHFDRRGPAYDASETHRRIADTLLAGARLQPGMRVLDLATGTGSVALKAAQQVGTDGRVLGLDLSDGMLAEARRKVPLDLADRLEFRQADAEQVELPAESFDYLFCASGLVMMRDIPQALRRWSRWLKPGGGLAFEVPAKPFGLSQWIAQAAAQYGVSLPYDQVGDTPAKCRKLLADAGLEVIAIETVEVADDSVGVEAAIRFLEDRLDHPAWRALLAAPQETRDLIRQAYAGHLERSARAGRVQSRVAQNFV